MPNHPKSMLADAEFLTELIAGQRRTIGFYLVSGIGLLFIGLSLIAAAFLVPQSPISQEVMKDLFGWGGALVSSLSAFPLKEILNSKEKIRILIARKR